MWPRTVQSLHSNSPFGVDCPEAKEETEFSRLMNYGYVQ